MFASKHDITSNIHSFFNFQQTQLKVFSLMGELILKKGLLSILDYSVIMKPKEFAGFGHFQKYFYRSDKLSK